MSEPVSPRPHRASRAVTVSALFRSRDRVEASLARLNAAGVPRDLIEVVASPEAAQAFTRRRRLASREVFRYAGLGGLAGLLLGVAVALVLVAAPGFQDEEVTALVQLIGPNVCTVGGAVLGAIAGFFVPRHPRPWHARAGQPGVIVVGVLVREGEVASIEEALRSHGGEEIRVD